MSEIAGPFTDDLNGILSQPEGRALMEAWISDTITCTVLGHLVEAHCAPRPLIGCTGEAALLECGRMGGVEGVLATLRNPAGMFELKQALAEQAEQHELVADLPATYDTPAHDFTIAPEDVSTDTVDQPTVGSL